MENRLLPNDVLMLRNLGDVVEPVGGRLDEERGFALDYSVKNSFAVRVLRFVRPQHRVLNPFDLQFEFASTVFLLVFFDSHAGISLRGEVNRVCTVDNQRRRGAAIAGFGSC